MGALAECGSSNAERNARATPPPTAASVPDTNQTKKTTMFVDEQLVRWDLVDTEATRCSLACNSVHTRRAMRS